MNTTKYFMKVTALQPISHIGRSASTGSLFNTEDVLLANGQSVAVPLVTGNAMKGVLRRVGMEAMLSLLGLDPEAANYLADDQPNPLTQNRLEILMNGSILSKQSSGRGINVDLGAKFADLIPWFAVVGGCLGNTMMQGRISVQPLTLICEENRARLEMMEEDIALGTFTGAETGERVHILEGEALIPARRTLQQQNFSHKDDFHGGAATRYLSEGERQKLLTAQTAEQEKREDADYQDDQTGQHVQMRYSLQTIKAGAKFFWRIDTFDLTPLMEDAFLTTMAFFLSRPYVGGNRRQGLGLVSVRCIGMNRVEPAKGEWSQDVGFKVGDPYLSHLKARRAEILAVIQALAPEGK